MTQRIGVSQVSNTIGSRQLQLAAEVEAAYGADVAALFDGS